MSKKIIISFLIFFSLLFSVPSVYAGLSTDNSPTVSFIDSSNKERKTDWRVKYFPIWRLDKGERELFLQVWIALPPLLRVEPGSTQDVRILDNTSENKSPFTDFKDIEKVMIFETQRPTSMFAFKKLDLGKDKSLANVKIKIIFPDSLSIIKHTRKCKDLGYYVIASDQGSHPFLLSVDCDNQEITSLVLTSSLETSLEPSRAKNDKKNIVKKNKIIIPIPVIKQNLKLGESMPLGEFKIVKRDSENFYKFAYKKALSHSKKFNRSLRRIQTAESVDEDLEPSRVFRAGILYSKVDLEVLFSWDYKPRAWDGYIQAKLLGPLKYLGSRRQENLYLDTSVAYMRPTNFFSGGALIGGLGLRLLFLPSQSFANGQDKKMVAPVLSINFRDLTSVTEDKSIDVSLEFSPLLNGLNGEGWRGSRFLTEATLGLWENDCVTFNLSVLYSILEVKNNRGSLKDDKLLGGVTLKW